jgi:hypothetical protein
VKNQETDAPITAGLRLPDGRLAVSAAALPATAGKHRKVLSADGDFVLHDDAAVLDLARRNVRRWLGLGDAGNDGEG